MQDIFNRFIEEEDGIETIEWLAILLVVVGLIAVVKTIGEKAKGKISDASSVFD